MLDGEVELRWPNGQLKRKCSFQRGIRHGWDRMWSEEGILLDEGRYVANKPVDVHRRYSEKGQLIEEIEYLDVARFNLRRWDETGILRVEAIWTENHYREKTWDRFQNVWVEKQGRWDGRKIVFV